MLLEVKQLRTSIVVIVSMGYIVWLGDTVESRQADMALKLVGRSLVTTYWDSEEPKLLGGVVGGA